MLRTQPPAWWRRLFFAEPAPAYVVVRAESARRCPECSASYTPRDHYCPGCKVAVPEWRFG